jgi:chemotaxis protein methyltransferase CheR
VTPDDFTLICRIVRAKTGFVVDESKASVIENRLAALVRLEGYHTLSELMGAIKTQRSDRIIWALADRVLPKDSSFFRDRTPFYQFRDVILPDLQARSTAAPLRIWSAGCGTGEEAYSLAMMLEAPQLGQENGAIEIVGSDLSERCLERARAGFYSHIEVQRGLPIRYLVNHFERQGESWLLSPEIRHRVQWSRVNLLSDIQSVGQFDVSLCPAGIG